MGRTAIKNFVWRIFNKKEAIFNQNGLKIKIKCEKPAIGGQGWRVASGLVEIQDFIKGKNLIVKKSKWKECSDGVSGEIEWEKKKWQ